MANSICINCGKRILQSRNGARKYCYACRIKIRKEKSYHYNLKRQEWIKHRNPSSASKALNDTPNKENSAYVRIWREKFSRGGCTREEFNYAVNQMFPDDKEPLSMKDIIKINNLKV